MIKAILVDDEIAALRSLQFLLENYCRDVMVLGTARSAREGIELVIEHNPDLIFLDVEMPAGSGFELMEQLPDLDCQVIFVTAHNQYAVRAFKYSAVDYLLKPVDIDELESAIKKVQLQKKFKINPRERYSALFENIRELLPSKLVLPECSGYSYVDLYKVLYVEVVGKKYFFVLNDGSTKSCFCNSINIVEILMERGFHLINPTCLVNLNMVERVDKLGNGQVILSNGLSLPIEGVGKDLFIDKLLLHNQNTKEK